MTLLNEEAGNTPQTVTIQNTSGASRKHLSLIRVVFFIAFIIMHPVISTTFAGARDSSTETPPPLQPTLLSEPPTGRTSFDITESK